VLLPVLVALASDLLLLGDWPRAHATLEQARRAMAEVRPQRDRWGDAVRGLEALAAALRGADPGLLPGSCDEVRLARGVGWLMRGDDRAHAELRSLVERDEPCLAAVMFHALATARSGKGNAALRARLESLAAVTPAPLLHAQLPFVRAILAGDGDDVEESYLVALGRDLSRWPLMHVWLRLAYGRWLRTRRRDEDARTELDTARVLLGLLGAAAPADPPTVVVLSEQELSIARLAAMGLSNREIGTRLHLSAHTIASRLHRGVFPKLGVASRRELATSLEKGDRCSTEKTH